MPTLHEFVRKGCNLNDIVYNEIRIGDQASGSIFHPDAELQETRRRPGKPVRQRANRRIWRYLGKEASPMDKETSQPVIDLSEQGAELKTGFALPSVKVISRRHTLS
jgi:hypothetical protein